MAVATVVAVVGVCVNVVGRSELVERSLVDRFLADQAALDKTSITASGLQQMEDENIALGDGLSAGMQQHAAAAKGVLAGVDDDTTRALRAADGAIKGAGLQSGSDALLGDLSGTQLRSEMSDGGMPTAANNAHVGESLQEELEASRKELANVVAGGNGGRYEDADMGLSESALNSVAEGMKDGLDAASIDPDTGLSSGQLALAPSAFSQRLAHRELRRVAAGTMSVGGSLTGLVDADDAFSGMTGSGGSGVGDDTDMVATAEPSGVHRAELRLKRQLAERKKMLARLHGKGAAGRDQTKQQHTRQASSVSRHKHARRGGTRVALRGSHGQAKGTEERTEALLKKQIQQRKRQLKILAGAHVH